MNVRKFFEKYAGEINGQFSEYDDQRFVLVVPLKDERFQSVKGEVKEIGEGKHQRIEFSSTVCPYRDGLDLKELLVENSRFTFGKLAIDNDIIQVEASTWADGVNEDILKDIVREVANRADEWEFKLTGEDVY